MRRPLLVVLLLLSAVPAMAEPRWQLQTTQERTLADGLSWATLLAGIGLDTAASWHSGYPAEAFVHEGERLAITGAVVLVVKHLVPRDRPCAPACGLDQPNASFFSGHTAFAFSTLGGARLAFALPLAVGTGGLRIAAGKHWPTDVLAGALVGALTSRIR